MARAPRVMAFWDSGFAVCDLPPTGAIFVGRGEDCDLAIDHASVSRRHARIHFAPLRLEDLGSSNGTRVEGRRIAPHAPMSLAAGSVVQVGAVTLVFDAPSTPSDAEAMSRSGPSAQLDRMLGLVAKSVISVLLLGETGVGKDVAAEAIHRRSPRAKGPMVRLNCAALNETLLESELFGHERGAFTGAVASKQGLFEAAHGGTLFLDEVGEMPMATQVKLLRALESREIVRVGSVVPRPVDVRILAATHRDLHDDIARGAFRADLYFRLNGISIIIPPLRERMHEVPSLSTLFLEGAGVSRALLSAGALQKLQEHAWPGNVRELRNVVARAIVLSDGGVISPEHIAFDVARTGTPSSRTADPPELSHLGQTGAHDEREKIADALRLCGGNQTRAAQMLGLSRRTFVNRLDAYAMPRPKKS